jgi:hypothetical protein
VAPQTAFDVDLAPGLSQGRTLVILGRESCAACRRAHPFLKSLVEVASRQADIRVAMVVPEGVAEAEMAFATSLGVHGARIGPLAADGRQDVDEAVGGGLGVGRGCGGLLRRDRRPLLHVRPRLAEELTLGSEALDLECGLGGLFLEMVDAPGEAFDVAFKGVGGALVGSGLLDEGGAFHGVGGAGAGAEVGFELALAMRVLRHRLCLPCERGDDVVQAGFGGLGVGDLGVALGDAGVDLGELRGGVVASGRGFARLVIVPLREERAGVADLADQRALGVQRLAEGALAETGLGIGLQQQDDGPLGIGRLATG